MTRFNGPLRIGAQPTGVVTSDSGIDVAGLKEVELSAGGKTLTRTPPAGSTLFDLNVLASAIPASVTQGLTVRVGTTASPTAYGVINSVTNGFTRGTVNSYGTISGDVVFDVTASVSAADFNAGGMKVRVLFVPRG